MSILIYELPLNNGPSVACLLQVHDFIDTEASADHLSEDESVLALKSAVIESFNNNSVLILPVHFVELVVLGSGVGIKRSIMSGFRHTHSG